MHVINPANTIILYPVIFCRVRQPCHVWRDAPVPFLACLSFLLHGIMLRKNSLEEIDGK